MTDTVVFIPSFDRAMQLDCTLRTFYKYCKNPDNYKIHVLYRTSSDAFEKGYSELKNIYTKVTFEKEDNFKSQLLKSILKKEYILFVVDDCIFVDEFDLETCKKVIQKDNIIGFSLRLGKNTNWCYSMRVRNSLPVFTTLEKENVLCGQWVNLEEGDFSYPLEVSSSLYKTNLIGILLEKCSYNNPNELEWALACNSQFFITYSNLAFYSTSVAFCNPVNKVQKVNQNRAGSFEEYSSISLQKKFDEGYRIDIKPFDKFVTKGCHQEVFLDFTKEINE